MEKYLKKFEAQAQYEAFIQTNDFVKPNVSYCVQENELYYNPLTQTWAEETQTWAEEYLTFEALENGTISFNIGKLTAIDMITSISYSTDNGETWNTTNNIMNKSKNLVIDVDVNAGDKVLWKGIASQFGGYYYDVDEDERYYTGGFFSSDCEFDAKGNVMSLLYGDNFKGKMTMQRTYTFGHLFNDYDGIKTCRIVNAKDLSLPATTLTEHCYFNMFKGCTSLITAPELPATTLVYNCYQAMFYGCSSLNYIKALFTTTPSNTYTNNWVSNVSSSGTFVKNSTATWDVTGVNGVPSGWTIKSASE